MRRTVFKILGLWALVMALAVIMVGGSLVRRTAIKNTVSAVGAVLAHAPTNANAQPDTTSTEADEQDSVIVVDEKKVKKAKREKSSEGEGVSIRIDESGIRIEGPGSGDEGTDSTGARIIFESGDWSVGDSRRYHERGADIVKFGEDVDIDSNELVRGDVVVLGGDVSIAGKVVGNVIVMMGEAFVRSGAEVNGDVIILGGELHEDAEVIIHGERVMLKSLNLSFASVPFLFGHQMHLLDLFLIPVKFFVSVILSFLIILFLRERVVRSHDQMMSGVFKSFGAGFLVAFIGTFVVTFLTIILLITLIGIPLAFVLVISCAAVFIIADTVFVYALGTKVNEKLNIQTKNPFAIVLVGMAVLYLPALIGFALSLLPFGGPMGALFKFFGVLLGLFAFLAGLGALFLSRFGSRSMSSEVPVPNPVNPQ